MKMLRKSLALSAICCSAVVVMAMSPAAGPCDEKKTCNSEAINVKLVSQECASACQKATEAKATVVKLQSTDCASQCSSAKATTVANKASDCASKCSGAKAASLVSADAGCDGCPIERAMHSLQAAVTEMDAMGGSKDCTIRTNVLAAMGELETIKTVMMNNPELAQAAMVAFASQKTACASTCDSAKAASLVANTSKADCASQCS
ncbi:MAG: hypothetical protein KC983_05340, partial [Phycisphaerales bacterium]|nr:hypothetical protein [Phycisphaerales bacterium]